MKQFSEMGFNEIILGNLKKAGYETPTAIQDQAIPVLLEGRDLLGIAQTGSGKTAAFSLPILQHLAQQKAKDGLLVPRVLILVPTRELSTQILKSLETYGEGLNIKSCAIFGGVKQTEQVKALKGGVDILIATPGRLLDLMEQGHIRLGKIEIFVMDEADRMLDMGFIDDINLLIEKLPEKKQTIFFSATMPDAVAGLSYDILNNPKRIDATPASSTVETISQKVIFCRKVDKFQLLKKILKEESTELVIVFTKTKNMADKVREYLIHSRIPATVIHGDKDQQDRDKALHNFKIGSYKVLIATDIAARGIDVQGISHVINFELPLEAESYVHRIGRTARAGKDGIAISLVDDSEKSILERIQRLIQIKLKTETYKGTPEAPGKWLQDGPIRKVTPPTPGKSQEKSAYLDHSKRQKVVKEGEAKPKAHPGFKSKKKR
jgi:ATP-dependent RNA helicase RhlE